MKLLIILALALGLSAQAMSSKPIKEPNSLSSQLVWVVKADGSKQCEGSGAPLETDAGVLNKAKIKIFESVKKQDGKMHIQMCTAASGTDNAYRIRREDLASAIALGFREEPAGIKLQKN